MTFQTVEQLQAQIATLTAENERLTNENWRFQMGEAVMLKPHLNLIGRLKAEIERLRALLKEAYVGNANLTAENDRLQKSPDYSRREYGAPKPKSYEDRWSTRWSDDDHDEFPSFQMLSK